MGLPRIGDDRTSHRSRTAVMNPLAARLACSGARSSTKGRAASTRRSFRRFQARGLSRTAYSSTVLRISEFSLS